MSGIADIITLHPTPKRTADELRRERGRLQDALRDGYEYPEPTEDGDDFSRFSFRTIILPERRVEIEAKAADLDKQIETQERIERRERFGHYAGRAGWPDRAVADTQSIDLDTTGPYYAALGALKESERGRILVFAGNPGTGKTTASAYLALQRATNGHGIPRFITATEYFRLGRYGDGGEKRDAILSERVLCLDDLGCEFADSKGNYLTDFDELVNTFYSDRELLIITTNICYSSPEHRARLKGAPTEPTFSERYGERALDRLRQAGRWILDRTPSKRRAQP